MESRCIKEEKEKVNIYRDTVHFFSVFIKILQDIGILVQVEPKCIQENDNECYPDFVCDWQGGKCIFEHKGSLSNKPKWVKKEIHDTERYLDLKLECAASDTILLFPMSNLQNLRPVLSNLDTDLCIWSFTLDRDKRELNFESHYGKLNCSEYNRLLEEKFNFELPWFSFIRFIRDPPPVAYLASFMWNDILRSFVSPWISSTEPFNVKIKRVIDRAKKSFPPASQANQITNKRLRQSLEFLNSIDWVDYPNDDNQITVKRARTLRGRMVSKILLKEYCKTKEGEQTTLFEYS